MPHDVRALLFDMIHAVRGIGMFVEGKTLEDFESDLMLRRATEREFEIIGEAMNRLSRIEPATVERISDHRKIIGFRNLLIHGYETIKPDLIFQTAKQSLPILQRELELLLEERG